MGQYLQTRALEDGKYVETANLHDDFEKALRRALGLQKLPEDLYFSIASAMDAYVDRANPKKFEAQWDAVERVAKAARDLRRAMRLGNAAFGLPATTSLRSGTKSRKPRLIYESWQRLEKPIVDDLVTPLEAWLGMWKPRVKPSGNRRGRPHHGLSVLRIRILGAFAHHGIGIDPHDYTGAAAKALHLVLLELNRRNTPIKAADWKIWANEYRDAEAFWADDYRAEQRPA